MWLLLRPQQRLLSRLPMFAARYILSSSQTECSKGLMRSNRSLIDL
jgi:hypothetical protein